MPLAAHRWEDPGPLICLVPADPSPSMTAAPFSRVYGVSLGVHLQELGRDIALPIEACVLMLLSEGVKEEVGPSGAGGKGALGPSAHPSPPPYCPGVPPSEHRSWEEAWPPVAEVIPIPLSDTPGGPARHCAVTLRPEELSYPGEPGRESSVAPCHKGRPRGRWWHMRGWQWGQGQSLVQGAFIHPSCLSIASPSAPAPAQTLRRWNSSETEAPPRSCGAPPTPHPRVSPRLSSAPPRHPPLL